MKQYEPTTEVDFVVIGAGAAGGIMAKELSVAGFSVVVLEQGGWGAYGHEQDYNKDELQNRFPTEADRLMNDPSGSGTPSAGTRMRKLPRAITPTEWWWEGAPWFTAAAAGGICRGSSRKRVT